jgi:hypothetical protein
MSHAIGGSLALSSPATFVATSKNSAQKGAITEISPLSSWHTARSYFANSGSSHRVSMRVSRNVLCSFSLLRDRKGGKKPLSKDCACGNK